MTIHTLATESAVRRARSWLIRQDDSVLVEQARIAAIPAPTGGESARAEYVRGRFVSLGMDVEQDEAGNVLAWYGTVSGAPAREHRPVAVVAHLDTVFPEDTSVEVHRDGGRLLAPGITDNARGLAAMLAVAGALTDAPVTPANPVVFAATVGEEGLGDLRGAKHLFREASPLRDAAAVVVVDGAGDRRIVTRAVGATRVRATLTGAGGHSWGDRGRPNPVYAMARAVAELSELRPPNEGATYSVNVGRVGGGTSVNSIPEEVWFELDLRADEPSALDWLRNAAIEIVDRAAAMERRSKPAQRGPGLRVRFERIGSRPCGVVSPDAPIIRVTEAVTRFLGLEPEFVSSSTDANVPIALGIPTVAIGAGGRAGGIHTLGEWFENDGGARGIERVLLTVLACSGVHGLDPLV